MKMNKQRKTLFSSFAYDFCEGKSEIIIEND